MGTFFTNLHARAEAPERIVEALVGAGALPAYLTEPEAGWVGVYPETTESQDLRLLERIAQALSTSAGTVVYASLVHDSDVWNFSLHDRGRLVDRYCSHPGYFAGRKRRPSGGKLEALLPLCRPGTSAGELEDLLKRHLTSESPLPEELGTRLTAEMEKQKQWLAGSYEEMKSRLTTMGAPMPSLKAMLGRLDRKTRKMVAGGGRADAAEDLAQAFARMLGIPDGRAVLGFKYISRGEAPEGFARLIPA
jgi:hypothetical protein